MVDQASSEARRIRTAVTLVFHDTRKAERWMRKGLAELGGQSPLSILDHAEGECVVRTILAKIAWGAAA